MADTTPIHGAPRKVLLATDLSARCDRALERAVSLAVAWSVQLIVLHVLEDIRDPADTRSRHTPPSWRRPPDAVSIAKRRVDQELRADIGRDVERAVVLVEEGDPAEVIERVAAAEGCELIVTGIAREEPLALRPHTLGKTVDQLLRRSPNPILIVRNRARSAYEHIVVATDFSDSSGYALQAALRLFPSQTLRLLHAFEPPYSTLVSDPPGYREQYRQALESELQAFLVTPYVRDEERRRIDPLIEFGRPETLVREYVVHHNADLVVLGTRGRGSVFEALIGSTAKSILSMLPSDALVVREPPPLARSPA
jgi:nucleotide-binding universal stress UspA family protein